jgi:hypothetical protein
MGPAFLLTFRSAGKGATSTRTAGTTVQHCPYCAQQSRSFLLQSPPSLTSQRMGPVLHPISACVYHHRGISLSTPCARHLLYPRIMPSNPQVRHLDPSSRQPSNSGNFLYNVTHACSLRAMSRVVQVATGQSTHPTISSRMQKILPQNYRRST